MNQVAFAQQFPTLAAYGLTEKSADRLIELLNENPSLQASPNQSDGAAEKSEDSFQENQEHLAV